MHFDLYKRLGFEEFKADNVPTSAEIKRAFRSKTKDCHPDLYPGDEEKKAEFLSITEAYEILMDDEKRAEYDKSGIIMSSNVERELLAIAIGNIMQSLSKIIEMNPEHALDLADIKQIVLDNIETNKQNLKNEVQIRETFIKKMKKINKNLKSKDPEDPIGKGIAMVIAAKNKEILDLNKNFKVLEVMVNVLNNYDYEYIKQLMTNDYTKASSTSNGFRTFSVRVDGA